MANKKKGKLTPEQVATKEKPGWQVLRSQAGTDAKKSSLQADETSPEIDALKKRFLGNNSLNIMTPADNAKEESSTIVVMVSKKQSDTPSGKKAVVVKNEKIIGEQG